MDLDRLQALSDIVDEFRKQPQSWTLLDVAQALRNRSLAGLTIDEVVEFPARFHHDHDYRELCVPSALASFVGKALSTRHIHSILDPWAGFGALLIPACNTIGFEVSAFALHPAENAIKLAKLIRGAPPITWRLGTLTETSGLPAAFDAIVSALPFGMNKERREFQLPDGPLQLTDSREHLLLAEACLRLTQAGIGIFVVRDTFLERREVGVFTNLSRLGLSATAAISLPAGTFLPYTGIPSTLLFVERVATTELFVAEYSQDERRSSTVLANWAAHRPGKKVALGRILKTDSYRGFAALDTEERFQILALQYGGTLTTLGQIAPEINVRNRGKPFQNKPNSVYAPVIGAGRVSTTAENVTVQEAAQIVLDRNTAHAEYVAGYLNTSLGRSIRQSCLRGATLQRMPRAAWKTLPIILPDLEPQLSIIEAVNQIRTLRSELDEIEGQIWTEPRHVIRLGQQIEQVNRREKFHDWLETLPYPLASILWAYHTTAEDQKQLRYELLLRFFEAYAQFHATILLSAFSPRMDALDELSRHLAVSHADPWRASFGIWVRVAEFLAKRARTLSRQTRDGEQQSAALFRIIDSDFRKLITSKAVISLLQQTNQQRNLWTGHGGIVSGRDAQERHVILVSELTTLREEFGNTWSAVSMIRPGLCRFSGGVYTHNMERLMGARTPFKQDTVTLGESLEDHALYLHERGQQRALGLWGLFRLLETAAGTDACYFYSRIDSGGARFVSHHYAPESEQWRPKEEVESLLQLLGPRSDP